MSPRHYPESFFELPNFADTDGERYPGPAPRFDNTRDDSDADALAFFSIATADDASE